MAKENLSTIWPILYFKANWPSKSYNFDLGVELIKADKTTLDEITEWTADNNCWLSNISGADDMRHNTEWFLAMRRPEEIEHVPVSEVGMSFVNSLQRAIVNSFLMCLQLVRSTTAICPFKFPAEIQEDAISDVDTGDDFYGINSDKPTVYLPETSEIADLSPAPRKPWGGGGQTKRVYTARSYIVHGEKLIDVVDPAVLKDAFTLARRSLQSILLNEELLKLYSNPGTTDRPVKGKRKKEKDTAYKAIRDFFLDLDLRGKVE